MRRVWTICLTIAALAFAADWSSAQVPTGTGIGRAGATRSELEQLAAKGESAPSVALRERLREGDFRPGDHIVLAIPTDSALSDTFVVRAGGPAGPVLRLPNLPEMSLRGVLRSELQAHLVAHIGRFLKDTVMRTTVLIPIGVLGELARPGYYRVPVDLPFSDVIMAAGGPTPSADLTRITVRRGSAEVLSRPAARAAIADGSTLDELGLSPGDEVLVSGRRERRWPTILSTVSMVSSLVLGLFAAGVFGGR